MQVLEISADRLIKAVPSALDPCPTLVTHLARSVKAYNARLALLGLVSIKTF
jgi:hypothetical protein